MQNGEAGKFISDSQKLERLTSSLIKMFLEGKDEAEIEQWAKTNIPDEILRDILSIQAGTKALDTIFPEMRKIVGSEELDHILGEIEKFLSEAAKRIDEINTSFDQVS